MAVGGRGTNIAHRNRHGPCIMPESQLDNNTLIFKKNTNAAWQHDEVVALALPAALACVQLAIISFKMNHLRRQSLLILCVTLLWTGQSAAAMVTVAVASNFTLPKYIFNGNQDMDIQIFYVSSLHILCSSYTE